MSSNANDFESGCDHGGERVRGTVKWFDARRGFGFLVGPNDLEIFVHYSEIQQDGFRTLTDGSEVNFRAVVGPKGLFAVDVQPDTSTSAGTDQDEPPAAP